MIILICSAIFLHNDGLCEKSNEGKILAAETIITPGIGIGQLSIGDMSSHVAEVMGKHKRKISYLEEKQSWEGFGFNTDKELIFNIGFDYSLEYNEHNNKTDYPIWKIYFKNDKVVCITISSFIYDIYDNTKYRKIGIPPHCNFLGSKNDMTKTLGEDFFEYVDSAKDVNCFYFDKGVSIVLTAGVIRTIIIFKPLSDNQKINVTRKYKE